MTARLDSAYQTELAALNATRIPRAALVLLTAIAGSGVVELLHRPAIFPTWLQFFAAQSALIAIPLLFGRTLAKGRTFELVAAAASIGVVVLMHLYAIVAPLSTTLLACGTICVMAGASLLAWWSVATQAGLVVASCLVFTATLMIRGEGGLETTLTLFNVFAGGLISLQGNRYFELHRRAILGEALRRDAEASISRALETFAKEINRGLSDEGLEDRVAALARAALGSDWTLVLQAEADDEHLRIVGGDGRFPTALDNLKALALPARNQLLGELDSDEARLVPNWREQISSLLHCDWRSTAMVASLRHREARLGVLVAGFRKADVPDLHLMSGVAQHAAIAIANARMMNELRQASAMKSEFLATMSHELRTPLHVIMGYTEMLGDFLDDAADPEVVQILRRLEQNEKSLTDLIEGTLDAHRLEAGRTIVKQVRFDSKSLFEQIQIDARWLPRTPGVQLRWELPDQSVAMESDPGKLKVIAKNLIGNALKFTKRGVVRVTAAADPVAGQLTLTISDSGPGIPTQEVPHIFEMFRQATPTASEVALAGVGLGLFIVREFVAQLGGEVSVAGCDLGGAEFCVTVPLRLNAPPVAQLVA